MADFYAAAHPSARGYRLSAFHFDDASGFVVTVSGVGLGTAAQAPRAIPSWIYSRLVLLFPVTLADVVHVLEHWTSYYDPDLRAQVAELAAELAKLPPPPAGAGGGQVIYQAPGVP